MNKLKESHYDEGWRWEGKGEGVRDKGERKGGKKTGILKLTKIINHFISQFDRYISNVYSLLFFYYFLTTSNYLSL